MEFSTKPYDITHLTLGLLVHYLGKLKSQIFCTYSVHFFETQHSCIIKCSVVSCHVPVLWCGIDDSMLILDG